MKNLMVEFEELKAKHESKIQVLDEELKKGYFHTFLNLRKEYDKYIFDLGDMFEKYDYIIPYEIYKFFYQASVRKYNLLFEYAEYVERSGNLPGAFLQEAISDLKLWSINVLLLLEQNNDYISEDPTIEVFSIQAYDAILETLNNYKNRRGYAITEKEVSEDYACAAHEILSHLGSTVADKAYEYYKTAVVLLEESSGDTSYNSWTYYTYYIALYELLLSYKSDIEEYGVACDFDIDEQICECMYNNYRQAQRCSRDKMIVQVNNLIKRKSYDAALKIANEIIDICEERAQNIQFRDVKLSLKNAYELMLSIPDLPAEDEKVTKEKLKDLVSKMTHEDFYCKDGENEYTMRPY